MGALATCAGGCCEWHMHAFDELCLVHGGATTIGHAGKRQPAPHGTLFLFRAGERHGYWNEPHTSSPPALWVLHYLARGDTYRDIERARADDPRKRVWRLSARQVDDYLGAFARVAAENASALPGRAVAESARLRLLLVAVARWAAGAGDGSARGATAAPDDPELVPLWCLVAESSEPVGELMRQFSARVPNYDSLRHRFRRTFGCSPRKMVVRLRLSRARSLLVETSMSVKEIAGAVGYGRQHEFARAFRRAAGVSPTDFRKRPALPVRSVEAK